MLKTYIGPEDSVMVHVQGNELGSVQHGEAIFVDDELAASVDWPEDLWRDGPPQQKIENEGGNLWQLVRA